MDLKILFCFFSIFHLASFRNINHVEFPYFGHRSLDPNFNFTLRLPHIIGLQFPSENVVVRTFPTIVNLFHENTKYTKNMSMELESSCGSSKSSFDKTDIVMLSLIEEDIDNITSKIVKSIRLDPLSVDFYPHKLTIKQFRDNIQHELMDSETKACKSYCERLEAVSNGDEDPPSAFWFRNFRKMCSLYHRNNCTFEEKAVDYPRMLAEMEKLIRTLKYRRLFDLFSSTCYIDELRRKIILELDNKTASLFPELTDNHHFIVTFIDFNGRLTATRVVDLYRIISSN